MSSYIYNTVIGFQFSNYLDEEIKYGFGINELDFYTRGMEFILHKNSTTLKNFFIH